MNSSTIHPTGPRLLVSAGLVWSHRGLLIQRRRSDAEHGAGRFELPGGKVERGEHPRTALARELLEEWGEAAKTLEIGSVAELCHHCYPPPNPEVVLIIFHVRAEGWNQENIGSFLQTEGDARVFEFSPEQLPIEEFLEADQEFMRSIACGEVRSPWAG